MIPKSQMTEEDIKHLFITPAIEANWDPTHLTMETRITDGRINLRGNLVSRETPNKADYVLYITVNYPIAIVEAKDNNHAVSHGILREHVGCTSMGTYQLFWRWRKRGDRGDQTVIMASPVQGNISRLGHSVHRNISGGR